MVVPMFVCLHHNLSNVPSIATYHIKLENLGFSRPHILQVYESQLEVVVVGLFLGCWICDKVLRLRHEILIFMDEGNCSR